MCESGKGCRHSRYIGNGDFKCALMSGVFNEKNLPESCANYEEALIDERV
jgi:hypothetical protein